jgi:hypothetical protein
MTDFEKLRSERNAAVDKMLREVHLKMGGDPDKPVRSNFNPDACYCTCGSENHVCEHDFQGWREFEDGRGGERVCSRCGMGSMSHSLRCGM